MTSIIYLLLLIGFGSLLYTRARRQRSRLPPGPPRDPLLGNLRRMPRYQPASVFHEWAKTYGDVMYIEVLGKRLVFLSTHQAAIDLLETRSAIYSDRPEFPLYEKLGWTSQQMLNLVHYGKQHARYRQIFHSLFNRQQCEEYKSLQAEAALQLAIDLIDSPHEAKEYDSRISKFATSIIVHMVAGHKITSFDDEYLQLSKMIYESLCLSGPPGSTPVDFFPILGYFPSWFPGAYYTGVARKWHSVTRKLFDYSVECVKREREAGTASPSFVLSQLEELESGSSVLENEAELKSTTATLFAAAEATTASTLAVFILAMILHPECQRKAQEEIDAVLGSERLPDFKDQQNLPHVESIYQETFRWNPVVPLGLPHRTTADDVYRGMHIPKGSLVFANIRALSLDETVYHDAGSFSPERYLPAPVGRGEPYFSSIFGFGRRICAGQHLAENSVWIAIATILATCKISNALDEHGNVIIPENTLTDGVDSHPKDLRCIITPRNPMVKSLLDP